MWLSQSNAQEIVSKVNRIINRSMNIMNEQGIIIASTNESRIGTFHEGAKIIIDNQLDELYIHNDKEYKGSIPGVNFPLVIRDQIIGVIGVTGDDEETYLFAKIIKQMTELLIFQILTNEEQELDESMKNRFLDEWLNGNNKNITKEFIVRGKSLGIDIAIPRRIAAFSIFVEPGGFSFDSLRKVNGAYKYLQEMITCDVYNFSMKSSTILVAGFAMQSDEEIFETVAEYKRIIETKFAVKVAVGIDSIQKENESGNYLMAFHSCVRAKKALFSCLRVHKNDIRFYDSLSMGIFADELPEIIKIEYIHKIFKGMDNKQIFDSVRVLETYYDLEGSITKAAKSLFIHKNTLQNKLKRIQKITGYDPRSINHSSLFSIAIYFYHEVRELLME